MSLINVCLIGLGRAGQFHLPNLARHPKAKLLYVVDTDEERVKRDAVTWGCKGLTSPEEALADEQVNAVIIATPTPTHFGYIMKALAAGKAVFSEKPVGYNLKEIDQAYKEAERVGKPLLCGFNRRFDPSWVKARNDIASGKIGAPHLARSTARDSPTPTVEYLETSHGFFHDSGVHDIDVLNWFLGGRPTEVYTVAHSHLPQIAALGDVDTVMMTFTFPNGCIASIDMSRQCAYGYDQRVEIFGDKGMVQVHNKHTTSTVLSGSDACALDTVQYSFPQRFAEAYYIELNHFVNVVLDGEELRVTWQDARNAYIIANAALLSSKTKAPVKIDYTIEED